ncbi:MAG: response regulator [Proteobacteria bacterium]|nr:response regulator [Pseudomonadota bacterium]
METVEKKVLVVDDEMHLRIFISTVFETNGFTVVTARDGADGYAKAQEFLPDLVTLDLMMPGEGGIKMYRKLRTDDRLKDVPVIIVSAVEDKTFSHSFALINAGQAIKVREPDGYIEKPPTAEKLLAATKGLL